MIAKPSNFPKVTFQITGILKIQYNALVSFPINNRLLIGVISGRFFNAIYKYCVQAKIIKKIVFNVGNSRILLLFRCAADICFCVGSKQTCCLGRLLIVS